MKITTDDDDRLDQALAGPLLAVPEQFAAQLMAALPDRRQRPAPAPQAARIRRAIQALVLAVCGALGAAEVLLFVCGLWTATVVGIA